MTLRDIRDTTAHAISESTPITTALALTICYVCYWIGSEQAANRVRLDAVEVTQQRQIAVAEKLADIAKANAVRLDSIEQKGQARP